MSRTTASPTLRPMRFEGERRSALALAIVPGRAPDVASLVDHAASAVGRAEREGALLAYGFFPDELAGEVLERLAWTSLGPVPELVRPLRLSAAARWLARAPQVHALASRAPLVLPFGRRRRAGVREITTRDPRVTRLWDRFSIDVIAAVERSASHLGAEIFDRPTSGHRVLVFEDGDRYVIRALCAFRVRDEGERRRGYVTELLHDRSVAGMRAASHLLGLALREMSDAGADSATAWSLHHSGSFPIYARHAFLPLRPARPLRLGVRPFDPAVAPYVRRREHWYLSLLDAV